MNMNKWILFILKFFSITRKVQLTVCLEKISKDINICGCAS